MFGHTGRIRPAIVLRIASRFLLGRSSSMLVNTRKLKKGSRSGTLFSVLELLRQRSAEPASSCGRLIVSIEVRPCPARAVHVELQKIQLRSEPDSRGANPSGIW